MIPEVGHFALILALGVTLVQGTLPLVGAARGIPEWTAIAVPAARAQLLFVVIAYGCLTYAFITNDFSVAYVAQNSNTAQPLVYQISGVWGAHEGSLLLWALFLAVWTVAVTVFSRVLPVTYTARVVAVLGLVSVGFYLFMLATSNPFDRLLPAPAEGRELNPLLQDPGLAIHPPMLYLGYVGLSVPFAFAIAALLDGRLDAAWVRWTRPWTVIAWVFLTLGIALGSWWAYYELGWGGWWFWDPVENASFMPWLVATALIHSLAVTEKRGAFKAWTVLLSIFAFSMSLLGTFLVRSGVLTSVHAFATDPTRGVYILGFLLVVVGGSLALYAWRAPLLKTGVKTALVSRDTALMLNNVFLAVATAAILLGTLYPIAIDALGGKISVGPPYFNFVFLSLTAPLGILIGIGMFVRWKQDSSARLIELLRIPAIIALVVALVITLALPQWYWMALVGIVMGVWIFFASAMALRERFANRNFMTTLRATPAGFYGMLLGHIGIGMSIIGITMTSLYNSENDVRMAPGDVYETAGYAFEFHGVETKDVLNYETTKGHFTVTELDSNYQVELFPEKRIYRVQTMPMTEADIDAGFTRDLFIALGEPLDDSGEVWAVRLQYKPFIRWIWGGAVIMAIGGLFAASDRRYRRMVRGKAPLPSGGLESAV